MNDLLNLFLSGFSPDGDAGMRAFQARVRKEIERMGDKDKAQLLAGVKLLSDTLATAALGVFSERLGLRTEEDLEDEEIEEQKQEEQDERFRELRVEKDLGLTGLEIPGQVEGFWASSPRAAEDLAAVSSHPDAALLFRQDRLAGSAIILGQTMTPGRKLGPWRVLSPPALVSYTPVKLMKTGAPMFFARITDGSISTIYTATLGPEINLETLRDEFGPAAAERARTDLEVLAQTVMLTPV